MGVSASASVLPMNIQDWFPSGWTGWISLQSKGFSRVFSKTTVQKHQFFGTQLSSQSNSHIHLVSDAIQPCPLLLLPSIFPSIRVFPSESVLHIRWPKYGSFSFSISPSNEYSELISITMDWLDLLAVQGTLKGFLQHHSSKAPISSAQLSLLVQLLHPYMTAGKTITLTRWTFVDKVVSLTDVEAVTPILWPPEVKS